MAIANTANPINNISVLFFIRDISKPPFHMTLNGFIYRIRLCWQGLRNKSTNSILRVV